MPKSRSNEIHFDIPANKEVQTAVGNVPGTKFDRMQADWAIEQNHPNAAILMSKFPVNNYAPQNDDGNYLHVPTSEGDLASSMGAKLDVSVGRYFVPDDHETPSLFDEWRGEDARLLVAHEDGERVEKQGAFYRAVVEKKSLGDVVDFNPWMTMDKDELKNSFKTLNDHVSQVANSTTDKDGSILNVAVRLSSQDRSVNMQLQTSAIEARRALNMVKVAANSRGIQLPELGNVVEAPTPKPQQSRRRSGMQMD